MWYKKYTEPTHVTGRSRAKHFISHRKASRHPIFQPRIIGSVVIACLLVCGAILTTNKSPHINSGTSDEARQPQVAQIDTTVMSKRINQVITSNPDMQISVAVIDMSTGNTSNYGDGDGYLAASVNKILTAVLYMHEVEQGSRDLDTVIDNAPASQHLGLMIEQSNNDAWKTLNNEMGHPALQSWARQIGLSSYDATSNSVAPKDVALLLSNLYQKRLLTPAHTELLLGYMQNTSETKYIENAVPDGVKVYRKSGWLNDRLHDAAIIDNGVRPYVLVIFTRMDGDYDFELGQNVFNTITAATVDTYIKS
ncbi:MAG: serine hydrolase [Candidatus Saccharimonadales bacterium]